MYREVEFLEKNMVIFDLLDVDYLYSVKVMLMVSFSMEDLYYKLCVFVEDL